MTTVGSDQLCNDLWGCSLELQSLEIFLEISAAALDSKQSTESLNEFAIMGQYWYWICKGKKEYFTAATYLGASGFKYTEQFYSGTLLYPMIMILMTDCSSLDEMLPKEHNADAYGRWYGEEVAFVGDCSENKINFDELTCIDDIVGPALIESLCLDNTKEEMINLLQENLMLNPKDWLYSKSGIPSWKSPRQKIIEVLERYNITIHDFDDDNDSKHGTPQIARPPS